MKLNFCTLFNSNYMSRGIAMYESLLKNCKDFHLYIFAFDDRCSEFLKAQKYANMTVISLKEFEDPELLRIKPTRSAAEYCWTCTASTILYSIEKFGLENCTYVDADMLFYSDPIVLFNELGSKSVLITEHRYTKDYDQSATSGKYCVQFVTFKNDFNGMKVLKWWREACIDWCYDRMEDGKFGDQKYLDDWTTKFEGVHELQHLGGGIAPWNVQQYSFELKNDQIIGKELSSGRKFEVVFYHFHALKLFNDDMAMLTIKEYALTENVKKMIYGPYLRLLKDVRLKIVSADKSFVNAGLSGPAPMKPMSFTVAVFYYLRDVKRSMKNLFGKNLRYHIRHHYFFKMGEL